MTGSPSVAAPGQDNSWRAQPQTTLQGEKGSGVSLLCLSRFTAPELVLDITHPATGAMFSTGDRMPFRFAYLTRFKLLNCRHNGSCTIPACTRGRLGDQMFPHERDHRIHGLHHFRESIIEIKVVACAPNQLLFTLHPVVEFLRLFGDQGAIRRKD